MRKRKCEYYQLYDPLPQIMVDNKHFMITGFFVRNKRVYILGLITVLSDKDLETYSIPFRIDVTDLIKKAKRDVLGFEVKVKVSKSKQSGSNE